jgi:hypothetical protein
MKQVTLSVFAIALIILASCSKEKVNNRQTPPLPPQPTQEVQLVSEWLTMDFSYGGGPVATESLEAVHSFSPTIYDEQEHTKLAFMRTSDTRRALPAYMVSDGKLLRLSFQLSLDRFTVIASNDDQSDYVGGVSLSDCQFRYIVVPNSVFRTILIDWNNYTEVANALGITD